MSRTYDEESVDMIELAGFIYSIFKKNRFRWYYYKVINENDYIIKEAYMLLDDYTKKLEKETPKWKNNLKKLEKRYKISVKINIGLLSIIILGVILNCFKII